MKKMGMDEEKVNKRKRVEIANHQQTMEVGTMKSTRISKERRPGSKKGEQLTDFWKHTRKRKKGK